MNILVTLDENYVPYLNVMLSSLKESNKGELFEIYLLHTNMNESALDKTRRILGDGGRINMIRADEKNARLRAHNVTLPEGDIL